MTPEETAVLGRKIADDIRAVQGLRADITPATLQPIINELDAAESAEATGLADDLRAIQAQTGGISSYHLDPVVAKADEMAKALAEAAPPAGEAPTVVDVPLATQEGATLNCTMGNWNGEPGAYSYVWAADGANVPNGSAATYAVLPGDVGKSFTCTVTATNGYGSGSSTSSAVVVA